jgi:hypothetical protein
VPPVVVQSSPIVLAQAPPVVVQSPPCPEKKCTTQYVQRSYYQPVTTYQTQTVMEQVTTQRTSYYYEPVTTYRYSAYYDPCSCGYTQVAVPTTSYQLRAQNCPVQSWVSRCVQVPVQSYQKVDYWQPQTTCCETTQGAPIYGPIPQQPLPQPPSISPTPEGPPSISGSKTSNLNDQWKQYYPQIEKTPEIRGTPGMSWRPQLGLPQPIQTNPVPRPNPPVKLDQIAVGPNSQVEGQVLRSDNSPKSNAQVLFVNAGTGTRHAIRANTAGRFQVELPTGSWHVYVHGADDLPVYHTRIDVSGSQFRQVSLVSRGN